MPIDSPLGQLHAAEAFVGEDWAAATLNNQQFEDCTFERCQLQHATLVDCRFRDCAFVNCDLSLLQLPGTSFSHVRFQASKLIGVNWTQGKWPPAKLSPHLTFDACLLSQSTFAALSLQECSFSQCVAQEVDLRECNLQAAAFHETDLTGSLFAGADLQGADFSTAQYYAIDVTLSKVKGAKFGLPEALALLKGLDIELV